MAEPLHVVLGSTGGLGGAVVRELRAQGRSVRAVSRRGGDVQANMADPEQAVAACAGASVVYCCLNAPYDKWPEMFPPLIDGAIEGAAAAGAKLAMGDNLYMYGPVDGPMTEESPEVATGRKGSVRVEIAETLRAAHDSGRVRVTIGRASDFFGPGVTDSVMGDRVFGAALRGETSNLLGNLDKPHTYTFIDDFARALIVLADCEEADGQVWHAPNAPAISTREFAAKVYRAAGKEPKMRAAPRLIVTMMSWFNPMMGEIQEMLYSWERPYIVDHSKFEKAFGASPTPLDEAIDTTLAWFKQLGCTPRLRRRNSRQRTVR